MTPKQHADLLLQEFDGNYNFNGDSTTLECAIRAVDLVLAVLELHNNKNTEYEFWIEVKKELNTHS